ncbi:MAG TPA: hypothetical protein DG048_09735 [Pseudoalteromonas sp.]|nr:hypothetical protein [Pseudoalteromonas sp.]|tara:strand:+ start:110 stop:487 length:378 start_codon:yes stop_codon:yes gene_type:complete
MGKRDFILDPIEASWIFDKAYSKQKHKIATAMEALMLAEPHKDPQVSLEEQHQLREILVGALDELEPIELWIINALLFEKLSLREVQHILSIPKTTLARKRDKILLKLRKKIEEIPEVQEYLNGE